MSKAAGTQVVFVLTTGWDYEDNSVLGGVHDAREGAGRHEGICGRVEKEREVPLPPA